LFGSRFVTIGSPNGKATGNEGAGAAIVHDGAGSARVYETSVIQRGNFPVTVQVRDPNDLYWYIERLDVEEDDRVIVASFRYATDIYGYYGTETETVMVVEGGVHQLFLDGRATSYGVFLSAGVDEERRVAEGFANSTSDYRAQHSFVAISQDSSSASPSGTAFVTLAIDFDQRPGDVHWVLLSSELVVDDNTGRLRKERAILAFGPEEVYGSELAGGIFKQTIDVSSVSRSAEVKLIFTDTGRDGLCCENGFGSYKLYNGSGTGSDNDLLVFGDAKEARRAVHVFSLY
jgi:hypothetical protein